jgi:hypothetical protein
VQALGAIGGLDAQRGVSVKRVGALSHGRIAVQYPDLPGAAAGAHNGQ